MSLHCLDRRRTRGCQTADSVGPVSRLPFEQLAEEGTIPNDWHSWVAKIACYSANRIA